MQDQDRFPILETKRLLLKMPSLELASDLTKLLQDRDISKNLSKVPYPYRLEDAQNFIKSSQENFFKENGEQEFGIFLKENGKIIGMSGLDISTRHNHATLGYWLGKAYWGEGYATEVAQRMVAYGFDELKVHRIACAHFHTNPASGKVMQKAGFSYEGRRRGHFKCGSEYLDILDYGILRDEIDN